MADYNGEEVRKSYDSQWKNYLENRLNNKKPEEQINELEMFLAGIRFTNSSVGIYYLLKYPQTQEFLLSKLEELEMYDHLENIRDNLKLKEQSLKSYAEALRLMEKVSEESH